MTTNGTPPALLSAMQTMLREAIARLVPPIVEQMLKAQVGTIIRGGRLQSGALVGTVPATVMAASYTDATTGQSGAVEIDQAPASGHPVALTVPRLGAANGVASLDASGKVPTSELPPPGMTDPTTTRGDLIARLSGGTGRLALGANGDVLQSDGTDVVWAANPSGFTNPMTTQDDLIVGGAAGAAARLAKGTSGQVLTVDATSGHLAWDTPSGGGSGSAIHHGALGSEPASPSNGDLYLPTNAASIEDYDGTAWQPWGPVYKLSKPPAVSTWTWVNQGTATAADSAGGVFLSVPAAGGGSSSALRMLTKAAPATPYTVTALFLPLVYPANYTDLGVCFYEASSGKVVSLNFEYNSAFGTTILRLLQYPTVNSNASATYLDIQNPSLGLPLWLRMGNDGTNRTYAVSVDGVNFVALKSVAKGDYFTSGESAVGVYLGANSVGPSAATLVSYA